MNLLKSIFDSPIVFRLGWSMLHFVWEGALVALLLGILLAALRRRQAPARYLACGVGMLVLAVLPVVTFLLVPAPAAKAVASAASRGAVPPAVDLLKAPPVHSSGHTAAMPVIAAAPGNHANFTTPAVAAVAAPVKAVPAQATTSATLNHALRQAIDFLPRILPWFVLVWCAGALVLSIYNLGGWMAVRRLRLLATSAVSHDIAESGAKLARRMGIMRAVKLLQSTLIESPMVIGAIKPIILLPAGLLTGLSPAQLESLLAHELAHIRRHDYLVNLLQGVVETLLFYHPVVWWVSRRIRIEREHCCDDQVIAVTQNRTAYVRALAAVAEAGRKEGREGREPLFSRAVKETRGAKGTRAFAVAATGGVLLSRVRRLLGLPDADAARSPRWLAGAVALVFCLLAAGTVVSRAADKPNPVKDKEFDAPKTWFLDLEIVDKALGEPIPKLSLNVNVDNRRFSYITDDQGHAQIEYTESAKYVAITPKANGYVPVNLTWRSFGTKDPVPDHFKLELERGSTIGGIVQDETGNPVANAEVRLSVPYRHGEQSSRVQLNLYDQAFKTDGQGKWRCDIVPKDINQPYVRLTHPDFLSDDMFGQTPVPPLAKLRDMTGVMVMKKGVAVAGYVLDDQGNPLTGAKVYQGADRFGSNYPEAKTDARGAFSFAHCRAGGELVLTVMAKGRSPDQKSFMLDKSVDNVEFRLTPGHVVKGRVVDADGKPMSHVMVATDTWRGHRALLARLDTDAEGRFSWNEAPADEILTDFLKQGYMDNRRVAIKASDQEIVITLRRPVKVSGTVVDADTGKPVDQFKVIQGIAWENQPEISWQRGDPEVHPRDGKFEFEITMPYPGYAVRIESGEYEPVVSRVFKDNEGNVSLEFKLKKGRVLAGTLKTPDGKPLANADIALCTGTNGPYITNGMITQHGQQTIVKSDENGRYQLPPQKGNFALVVVCDQGYAEARAEQLAKSLDIVVPPWGKIEGTVHIGAKPGARQSMTASHQDPPGPQPQEPRIYHELRATTDEQGKFSLERVPPGKTWVGMQVQISENTYGSTQAKTVEVAAGQTTQVDLGGVGRPIVGRMIVPKELEGKMNPASANTFMMTKIENLRDYRPANWKDLDKAARQKVTDDYLKSPEYLAYMKQQENRKNFAIIVHSDGTFRVEDIPAGTYQFSSVVNEASNKGFYGGEAIATANIDIVVPEIPGGRSDEALDVGNIPYKAVKRLNVGDLAPEFSAKTFDNKTVKLSDFKGKLVVVHFWSLGNPQGVESDLADLKAAQERYGKDGRMVLISLNFDTKGESIKAFTEKNKMSWTQGLLGGWSESKVAEDWCLRGLPAIYVVSGDEKILAKYIRGNQVAGEIETAMKGGK